MTSRHTGHPHGQHAKVVGNGPAKSKKYNTHRLDIQMDGPIFIFNYGGGGGGGGGGE